MAIVVDKEQEAILRRIWISKALDSQRLALLRSRSKEIPGSEIYGLRTKEIQFLEKLSEEFKV